MFERLRLNVTFHFDHSKPLPDAKLLHPFGSDM